MSDRPFIDFKQCKERIDLPAVLERFDIADQFVRRGDTLTGPCPLPGHQVNKVGADRNKQQFKVSRKDGVWLWHCFAPDHQIGGDVVRFVQEMLECDISHVRFWFAREFGELLDLKKPKNRPREVGEPEPKAAHDETGWTSEPSQANRVPAKIADAPKPVKPLRFRLDLDPASPYLLNDRGFSIEVIQKFGLGLCKRGVLKDYIAIPVYRWPLENPDENPCGYVGRWPGSDFDEAQGCPRYRVPTGFETSRFIFGLKEAIAETPVDSPLVLVEGPLKAIWLHDQGIVNAISSFTASVSDEQADIFVSTRRSICLCFDGNEAGYAAMEAAAQKLKMRTFVRVERLPDGTEPDELSSDELRRTFDFL